MKYVDRFLRDRRIDQAVRRIPIGAAVLDVGCHDGELFRALGHSLRHGLGIDSELVGELQGERYRLVPGWFPQDLPADAGEFDVVTMLAVFEHIPPDQQDGVVEACRKHLRPGGRVVITVPSPIVDPILDGLVKIKVIDGIEHEQHFGFKPSDLQPLFERNGFTLEHEHKFQLGLNNLLVFVRTD